MSIYLIIGLVIVLLLVAQFVVSRRKALKRRRESLIGAWGKPHEKNRLMAYIRLFHELTPPDFAAVNHIDKETLHDLDLERLFELVDHTTSRAGQQYLYAQLMSPTGSRELIRERARLMDWASQHEEERLHLQLALSRLASPQLYFVPLLFANKLPFDKSTYIASEALKWIALFFTLGTFIDLLFFLPVILIFFVNLAFHYLNKKHIKKHLNAFIQLSNVITTAENAIAIDTPLIDKAKLAVLAKENRKLQRNLGIINTDMLGQDFNESAAFVWAFMEYIKIMFLLEVNSYYKSLRLLEHNKKGLLEMYSMLGRADAIIAGASFRASLPYYCAPNMLTADEAPAIHIEEAFHPLIDNCVPNSITIPNGKGILITGSNMSGKTSFLRTVGINILFAQSLSLCLAREFTIPPLRLFSYMRITDDVQAGKSYYIREVERIYEFLSEAQGRRHNFFLLDEIFKGTNTIERVAAATAVLSHLNSRDSYVMAATHDVELIRLLEDSFDAYYFSEEILEGEAIYFGHKIKKGGLKQGNAIKLLEYFQFPRHIIDQALGLKGKMLDNDKLANKENIQ